MPKVIRSLPRHLPIIQPNGSPARTIAVALNMSKAFDTINIHTLIRKLLQTNIPDTIIKFTSQTTLRDAKPTQHIETTHPDNVNLKLAFHKVASFHPHYLTFTLQTYHHPMHRLRSWPTQTTSHPHKCSQEIHTTIPMATHQQVLGLTLDPKLTYSTHIHNISVHAHKPLQIITALTETGWTITKYCAHIHPTLAALKRYFPASRLAPLPNSEQINLPSSNHAYTKSTPKHIHHHYAPSVTSTWHLFNCTHIRTTLSPLDLLTDHAGVKETLARWRDKLDGGPKAGWSDSPHKQGSREWVDIIMLSNLCLPSLHAFLCYIVETVEVIQWAGLCKKGALHHVRCIFCCQTTLTRDVSFEVSPLLSLFFAACESCM